MHNTWPWEITRERRGVVVRRRRGHEISPAPLILSLSPSIPSSPVSLSSSVTSYIHRFHSLLPLTFLLRPWEVAGLQQFSYFFKSFSFIGLNAIREAVFWLQIKPLITAKVCENIHVETPLNKTLNFSRLSRPLTKHIRWLHSVIRSASCGCCYLPESISLLFG